MFGVDLKTYNSDEDGDLAKYLESLKIDYTAFYRGVVVENYDPERKGRIKVRIPQIYGADPMLQYFVPTNSIPWAICAISPAGNDSGTFLPPNIGDNVFVTFENGMYNHPIYFGGIYTNRNEDVSVSGVSSHNLYANRIAPKTIDDMPLEVVNGTERVLYKSLKGAIIYIDDKDGEEKITITDQSGQSIIMENLSDEAVRRRGNSLGNNLSQIVLTNNSGDSITLTNGKIHIKSRNVVIEADNFEQINTGNLENEENVADIILGG